MAPPTAPTTVTLPRDAQAGLGMALVAGMAAGAVSFMVARGLGLLEPGNTLVAITLAVAVAGGVWWKRRGPGTGRTLRVEEAHLVVVDERGRELGRCLRADLPVTLGLHTYNPNALFGSLQPALELRIPDLPPLTVGATGVPIHGWPKDHNWNAVEFLMDPTQWAALLVALSLDIPAPPPPSSEDDGPA